MPVNQTLTVSATPALPPAFLRGDPNPTVHDTAIDRGLELALRFRRHVLCESAADSNADDHLNIADAIFLLSYSFNGVAPSARFRIAVSRACLVAPARRACSERRCRCP